MLFVALLAGLGWFTPQCLGQERPNVILFLADDISWDDLGCYGHPTIKTPNIDALADSGLRFTNAYLVTSSCSPSRLLVPDRKPGDFNWRD